MTELEEFQALVADLGWADVPRIQEHLDTQHCWRDTFFQDALLHAKRSKIRQLMRRVKNAAGRPQWHSIEVTDAQGATHRLYKQEQLFHTEDYLRVINDAVGKVQYWQREAESLRDALHKRYQEQLPLPWE